MATARHLLNPTRIEALKEPGRYADGAGLFLFVRPTGTKNWIIRVQKDGRRRDIGLGGYGDRTRSFTCPHVRRLRS